MIRNLNKNITYDEHDHNENNEKQTNLKQYRKKIIEGEQFVYLQQNIILKNKIAFRLSKYIGVVL